MDQINKYLTTTTEREVAGKKREFSKAKGRIMADFSSRLQSRKIQQGLRFLETPTEKAEFLTQMSYMGDMKQNLEALQTFEGLGLILYLTAREHDKEITEEEAQDWINIDGMPDLIQFVMNDLLEVDATELVEQAKNQKAAASEATGLPPR